MAKTELDRPKCITENTNDEAVLTSEQKAAWVEYQIHQTTLGNLDIVACPYCGASVAMGRDEICCKPMNDVASVLLDRMEADELSWKVADKPPASIPVEATDSSNKTTTIH